MYDLYTQGMRTEMPMPMYMPERSSGLESFLSGAGSLLSGGLGSILSTGLNLIGQASQNRKQEEFYKKYMSPEGRRNQMVQAGINPAAIAQGISGSSAPQMTAAAPTNAFDGVGEQLGSSVNNALSAEAIKANIANTQADTAATRLENDFNRQTFDQRIDAIAKTNNWTDEKIKQMKIFNKYADDLYDWNAQKAKQDYNNAVKQWELYQSEIDKNAAQEDLYNA